MVFRNYTVNSKRETKSESSAMEHVSLVLHFCTLVVIITAVFLHMPIKIAEELRGTGNLTIYVERIVSGGYDVIPPKLFLEMEAGGITRFTKDEHAVREVIVNKEFVFGLVDYRSSIMFRMRDAAHSHKPCRGLLAITASEAILGRYSVYRMDSVNWVVMKLTGMQ